MSATPTWLKSENGGMNVSELSEASPSGYSHAEWIRYNEYKVESQVYRALGVLTLAAGLSLEPALGWFWLLLWLPGTVLLFRGLWAIRTADSIRFDIGGVNDAE